MVFDEVRYREPERRCRPDRDRRYACLAYEVPGARDLPIFLDRGTADAIERHALRDTSVELGGILLGKECLDDQTGQPFVWVTESLEAKHYENTEASFTYTHDSWEEISRDRDRLHPELDIVGWYHTHPGFGIFLSGHDLFIHRNFFAQPLQLAYVVDPIRQTRGFFQWRDGAMAQVAGYTLTADRGDRIALARLVNDLEDIPNTESGGGGFSPRLEAELIAMLTRPAPPHVSAADRTLTATVFALLGLLAGVLMVLTVLGMNQLFKSLQDQTAKVDKMTESLDRTSAAQRLAFETLISASGSTEHDPRMILTQYNKIVHDLDAASVKLEHQSTINDALAAKTRGLEGANDTLKSELALANSRANQYEKDAVEASRLRDRVETLEIETARQARKLAENEDLLDTPPAKKVVELAHSYDRAWYTAAAGWAMAALLALGLGALFGLKPLPEAEPATPPPTPRADAEGTPPHHIT
jgi:proteasome lid subunit RPN8/RPN11/tetrahydromethanopterin S-methyltransferase subunit B